MAVSSVSPPSASPTEGDDPCEIDVTSVAIHSVTLPICLCGLAGNGAVLWLIIMSDITGFIFSLAVTDFIFLLLALPSALLFLLEDMSCSPILPLMYLSFLFQLSMVSYYWGLFQLTFISAIWNMSRFCRLCCCCALPERLLWVVTSVHFWAFFALFTVIPTVTYVCQSHEQEHCRVGFISVFAIILLLVAGPMLITHTIDIVKAKCGSPQQQPTRRDIVIILVILFILSLNLWNFLQQFGYIAVSRQVFFLLACINSTIKPLVYFLAGRCWKPCSVWSLRESLQRVFEEPEENTPSSNAAAMGSVI